MTSSILLSASLILVSSLTLSCKKTPVGPETPVDDSKNYTVSTSAGSGQGGIFDASGA